MTTATLSLTLQNGSEKVTIPASLKQSTVLYFMRAASCAQCNRHARELDALLPELEKRKLGVIIIVPEGLEAAAKVKARNHLTIPVMAGNGGAHALAGLDKKVLGLIQESGTVVIDSKGNVLYKRVATNPENSYNGKEFQVYLATI
jgi:peroxiredoxin